MKKVKKYFSFAELNEDFMILERIHYLIIQAYICGEVKIVQINDFSEQLNLIRDSIDTLEKDEENIYNIAKIKSKMQHFYTEILEDEELLTMAYKNSL